LLAASIQDVSTLHVTALTPNASGFSIQLNQAIDASVLNLYDQANVLGAADVTLAGATSGAVRGSIVLNAAGDGFTFIRTTAALAPDSYTVTLRSAANGFKAASGGGLLDGNADGT